MIFGKNHKNLHTRARIVLVCVALLFLPCARADDIDDEIALKTTQIEQLKTAIAEIDSEFLRCKKSKSAWTTATVVGGVGVVATGTAATIQGIKLKQIKNTKEAKKSNE